MGLFKDMAEARFWDKWDRKFSFGSERYIKPFNTTVKETAESLNISEGQTDVDIATDISDWIHNHHEYKLSKRWKRPEATVREGSGDCEDYTFLLASILPHYGINEFSIVTGEAQIADKGEFHVWLEIDGNVIDPTASKSQQENVEYESELVYDIETEGY